MPAEGLLEPPPPPQGSVWAGPQCRRRVAGSRGGPSEAEPLQQRILPPIRDSVFFWGGAQVEISEAPTGLKLPGPGGRSWAKQPPTGFECGTRRGLDPLFSTRLVRVSGLRSANRHLRRRCDQRWTKNGQKRRNWKFPPTLGADVGEAPADLTWQEGKCGPNRPSVEPTAPIDVLGSQRATLGGDGRVRPGSRGQQVKVKMLFFKLDVSCFIASS